MERPPLRKVRTLSDRVFSYVYALKASDRLLLYLGVIGVMLSIGYVFFALNAHFTHTIPSPGGVLTEGIIGTPRFVNPILAITRADHDLVSLTYAGVLGIGASGELINDLAESLTISEDGTVYNVILRNNIYFHDGTPIHASDVAFTIELIQEPALKSPLRGNWSGVAVEVLGDRELNLVLEDPYVPFIENLTVGIMPQHIWESLTIEELPFSQHNTEPIGSGPYQVTSVHRNESGLINAYTLTASDATGKRPNIDRLELTFFENEDQVVTALRDRTISSTAALTELSVGSVDTTAYTVRTQALPRVFGVFFNQNKAATLRDADVRKALDTMIDRTELINEVLNGYGSPTHSPIPPGFLSADITPEISRSTEERKTEAEALLSGAGWARTDTGTWQKDIDGVATTLGFTIKTTDAPVFEKTAAYLTRTWGELGVIIGVESFEQNDLVQAVIRSRDYQMLLFGTDIGRSLDFYPFWHSSQREDPGLNVALYTNMTVDKLLEKIRTTQDPTIRTSDLQSFADNITSEDPAVFLFSPVSLYVYAHPLQPEPIAKITRASERFSTIRNWFANGSELWPIFAQ